VSDSAPGDVVVFVGPSLPRNAPKEDHPNLRWQPPARRGDLYRARDSGARCICLIDGVFGHSLAISPREVSDIIRDGAIVIGAASMGALRAADCAPLGAIGVGVVFRMYRLGLLESDDEVAVAIDPEDNYRAISVALINVRYAVSRARRAGRISKTVGLAIIRAAQSLYFPARNWRAILSNAGVKDNDRSIEAFCRAYDVKSDDAARALTFIEKYLHRDPLSSSNATSSNRSLPVVLRKKRYSGHDSLFGYSENYLQAALLEWLCGTGRFVEYIWPVLVVSSAIPKVPQEELPDRPRALRELVPNILAGVLENRQRFSEQLWHELKFVNRLDAELMLWYAHQTYSQAALDAMIDIPLTTLLRVRAEIVKRYGLRSWTELEENCVDNRLFGAIPIQWLFAACDKLALARAYYEVQQYR